MLQALRSHVGSWIVKILFVLLIISFGVWGIGDIFRGRGPSNTVADVGIVKISTVALDQEFRQQLSRLSQVFGGRIDAEQVRQMGLLNQSLQRLIQSTLFDIAAQDAGLRVDDAAVARQVRAEPAFRNQLGEFDPGIFERVLAANNLNEGDYVRLMRSEIARQQLIDAVGGGARAPALLADDLYRFRAEKRVAETLTIANASVGDVGTPDEATLQKYHDDHAVRFTAPEYRGLTVASLSADDIASDLPVTDDELRAAYASRAGEFRTPERRDILEVTVPDEEKAKAIAEAARKNGDLKAAAAGVEVQKLDNVAEDEIVVPDLAKAAFALPTGSVGDPVHSPLGWHVLSIAKIMPSSEQSFEEVRDKLLKDVRHDKAADKIYELSNRLEDVLAGGASIEEAAQKVNLKLTGIDVVDATGKKPDGTMVANVPDLPQILAAAFGLAKDQTSKLTDTQSGGGYFVVRVDSVTPAAVRPLDQVRAEVQAAWQADQRAAKAEAAAKRIAEQARGGAKLPDLASSVGGKVGATGPLTRDGQAPEGVPPDLVRALFAMKVGEVTTVPTADGQMVARLTEIQPADPAADAAKTEVAQLTDSVSQSIANDVLAQFTDALREKTGVQVHDDALKSMYGSPN